MGTGNKNRERKLLLTLKVRYDKKWFTPNGIYVEYIIDGDATIQNIFN